MLYKFVLLDHTRFTHNLATMVCFFPSSKIVKLNVSFLKRKVICQFIEKYFSLSELRGNICCVFFFFFLLNILFVLL